MLQQSILQNALREVSVVVTPTLQRCPLVEWTWPLTDETYLAFVHYMDRIWVCLTTERTIRNSGRAMTKSDFPKSAIAKSVPKSSAVWLIGIAIFV